MKNLMEYKGYYAKVNYSGEDEVFYGTIQGINDSISFEGESVEELQMALNEAVDDYLEMCTRLNKEPEKNYKGSFNVRISPEAHKKAVIIATSKGISLNQFVEDSIIESINKNL